MKRRQLYGPLDLPPGGARRLVQDAVELLRITRLVRAALPEELREQCEFIREESGVAILRAFSSSWATRLRFESAGLIEVLQPVLGRNVRAIKILVRPKTSSPPAPQPESKQRLSAEAVRHLSAAAAAIDDAELAAALMRIAQQTRHS